MTPLLDLNPDELLSTTRAVRKRLDFERPVSLDVIRESLELAMQAPSGSNSQGWHWIVVTDTGLKTQIADYYRRSYTRYAGLKPASANATEERIKDSATYLADNMAKAPALVIAAIDSDAPLPTTNQAPLWGSLLPAAWSFALALRARGLGTTWTTLHLSYEREVAELLGLPETVHQGVLFPVAYTKGTDFKPGKRKDPEPVLHINRW